MNRVKIPIKFIWKKAYKRYIVILPFASILFLEIGLLSLKQVLKIPMYTFYIPLLLVLLIPLFIPFIRDYLSFKKFNIYLIATVMVITNIMISYYYIHIAMEHEGVIRIFILSFMGLFYGTFLWDFFMGLFSIKELYSEHKETLKDFIKNNKNNFPIYIDGSVSADGPDSNFLPFKENEKSIFLKIALYFSLPLLLLGKSGAYFLGVAMWLVPDIDDETLLYIAYKDKETDNIEDVKLNLNLFLEEQTPYLNFDNVTFPTEPNLVAYVHDVMIDHKQVEIFDEMEKIRFIDGIFREYKKEGYTFYHSEEFNKVRALALYDESLELSIESQAGVYKYILLSLLLIDPIKESDIYFELKQAQYIEYKIELLDEKIEKVIEILRIKNEC